MERKEYRLLDNARSTLNAMPWVFLGLGAVFVLLFVFRSLEKDDKTTRDLLLFGTVILLPFIIGGAWSFFLGRSPEKGTIAVDNEGIESLDPTKPGGRLRWTEIRAISSHPFFPCIRLHRSDGQPPFLVSQDLEGADEVIQLLLEKAPLLPSALSFPVTLQKKIPRQVSKIQGFLLIAAIYFWRLGVPGVIAGIGLGSIFFFRAVNAYLLDDRLRLVVTRTEVQLHRRQHTSTTAFSTVTAVELRPNSDPSKDFYQYTVVVRLSDGEELDVCPFGCDPFAVYCALHTAWEQNREQSSAPSPPPRPKTQDFS